MNQVIQYNFPTIIRYGYQVRSELPKAIKDMGFNRPLVVTDRELASLPMAEEIKNYLTNAGLYSKVFSGTYGNPLKSHANLGANEYRVHNADCIVAFGGGAPIDVAKCIAVLVSHKGDLFEYEDRAGAKPIEISQLPSIFSIPTTAGTGSEVGRSAVVSDDATKVKRIIFSPGLLPKMVFLDPELTLKLPASITASTGMDALTHLIEAYLSKGFQPLCDGIALEGIGIVSQSLKKCVEFAKANEYSPSEEHIEARGLMLNAATMGGVAFQKGLGACHSAAHALSTVCDMHHGLANGILLPYIMEFNMSTSKEKFKRMAEAAGLGSKSPKSFIQWLEDLKAEIGIPKYLSEANVQKSHIDDLVKIAIQDVCHPFNPRSVSEEDFREIFTKAIGE
ncbi:MAG: iron-containing alcohol dehydrogenase [Leptospiraceae bacterium]|nr:iron-containing alcohol dehydrogenase [Leptospiraceae bacterium]